MEPHQCILLLPKVCRPSHIAPTIVFFSVNVATLPFYISAGHVAILQWMLHHSLATGLEQDDFGATPVHDAAEQGQLECLYVFYNHSVDLNQQDCDGLTPE